MLEFNDSWISKIDIVKNHCDLEFEDSFWRLLKVIPNLLDAIKMYYDVNKCFRKGDKPYLEISLFQDKIEDIVEHLKVIEIWKKEN